ALCVESLHAFGLSENDFCIRLSDRTLWFLFLENIGVPDEATAVKVLSVVDKLERVAHDGLVEMMTAALAGTPLDPAETLATVREFVALKSLDELNAFFSARSGAEKALARLEEWKKLLGLLEALGVGAFVRTDLTIVRGLAYYTGFVFEAFQLVGEGRALAGGGRYDKLVKKLGGPEMPAVGFGMGDVTLRNLLEQQTLLPQIVDEPDFYAIILGEENRAEALSDVAVLRDCGFRVEYAFKDGKFGKLIQTAEQTGARYALIYGTNELALGVVKVRDTQERREIAFPRENLAGTLAEILERGLPVIEEPHCRGDGSCGHCTCGKHE
ncbi:MAG: ATP phosphoribosyltransferase regulatory subunit, partial [Opitutales bacterium]|nr:ATP phosphoribosyltransferase regulatory subunit [Opitutales bacterium]